MYSKKIRSAIKRGQLISHKEVLKRYSVKDRADIAERARYYKVRAELRRIRRSKNMSQEELARKMGVKRELISRIESGRQNITLETLFKIAEAVGKEFKFSFK